MAFDPGIPRAASSALLALAGAADERADELEADAAVLDAIADDIAGTVATVAGGLGGDVWLGHAARVVTSRFDEATVTEAVAVAALWAAAAELRRRAVTEAGVADAYRSQAQAAA